ncbi:hypothetical protein [Thauera chlorobenzoica]|uniref:hypothetical protein n=1 Tax=Thauera chlorobenzoica TaxID=96773 RepID=UPI001E6480CC|nr:hypothetical protein [Thauera chlorobenzoica]
MNAPLEIVQPLAALGDLTRILGTGGQPQGCAQERETERENHPTPSIQHQTRPRPTGAQTVP